MVNKILGYDVIWRGTAEVNHKLEGQQCNVSSRVDVALVSSPKQKKERVYMQWEGVWQVENKAVFSREYETAGGDLVGDVDPEIASRIDAALASSPKR